MATCDEVSAFLSAFKAKSRALGMNFRGDRLKNMQTLAELEISAFERETEILALDVCHYSSGPEEDTLNHQEEMWVFGKNIKGHEIYIKITLGGQGRSTYCISFHIAKHKMNYPYAKKN